jgi:hypothetical protein
VFNGNIIFSYDSNLMGTLGTFGIGSIILKGCGREYDINPLHTVRTCATLININFESMK